jgi:hypothetical protein
MTSKESPNLGAIKTATRCAPAIAAASKRSGKEVGLLDTVLRVVVEAGIHNIIAGNA